MSILSQQKQSVNTDFPNLRPSLDLRFALAKKLDPRITFTRGSSGTYFGPDGLMRTAGVNEPRFDHDPVTGQSLGLLIEELRFNLYTYSDIEGTVGAKPTNMNLFGPGNGQTAVVSTDVSLGPNGQSAKHTRGTPSDSNVGFFAYGSHTLNSTYVASIYVYIPSSQAQNFSGKFIRFQVEAVGASGVVGANVNIVDRWQRVSVTYTPTSATSVPIVARTNAVAGSFFYTDCWQLEQGSFPTSYIPTTASTVTRSADNASMTGNNFSSWYNQTEGTIFVDAFKQSLPPSGQFPIIVSFSDGTTNNSIEVGYLTTSSAGFEVKVNNLFTVNYYPSASSSLRRKLNFAYKNNQFSAATNGSLQSRLSGSLPSLSRLTLGNRLTNGTPLVLNGTISRLTYYPIQLTNQQLINLTS